MNSYPYDTGLKVYFCDPQSPWQRGSNENPNGLLQQYFAKMLSLVYEPAIGPGRASPNPVLLLAVRSKNYLVVRL